MLLNQPHLGTSIYHLLVFPIELYDALAFSEDDPTVGELIFYRNKENESYKRDLLEELLHLWKSRFIRIQP